VRLVWLF